VSEAGAYPSGTNIVPGRIGWPGTNTLGYLAGAATLSIMGLFATFSINDIRHNNTAIMQNVVMLSVAFKLLLC
jgi:hypothetical protein